MNMRQLVFVYFFSAVMLVSAIPGEAMPGPDQIDSLKQVVATLNDKQEKADNLLLLTQAFYESESLDSAISCCEKALELSTRIGYQQGVAEACYKQGLIQNKKSDYNAALNSILLYIETVKPLNDNKGLSKGYYFLGTLLRQQGNIDSAVLLYHESLTMFIKLNDTFRIIAAYNAMGNVFLEISEYDSAAYYYIKTIKLCEASGNQQLLGTLYNNLGKTFTRLEDYEEATRYLEMSLDLNKKNKNERGLALCLINLGNNYNESDNTKEALKYYDQAAEILRSLPESINVIDLFNNYAEVYTKQEKYELALNNYDKALTYYLNQKQAEGIMITMKNKGDIYSLQGKYEKAQAIFDSSLNIASRTGYRKNRLDILGAISNNYFRAGDYKKAYEYQYKYYNLNDSLFSLVKAKAIKDLEQKYEKEKDQAHILALEKENLQKTSERNAIMFSGLGIIVLALFIVIYFRQRAVHVKIVAQQKIRQLEEEKKLMAAKLLVEGQEEERKRIAKELHDGLGVLLSATKMQFSTISDSSPENKVLIDKATRMLEQATGDVRKISHNMMPGLLTKLGFFEAVEDLLEHIGDTKDLNAACTITGSQDRLSENKEIMLYRIVQEMVNNTLKHAEAKNIELKINMDGGRLEIEYSDDGRGFDVAKEMESESIGLKSIQSRVNFLNGTLGLESRPGEGTRYSIRIPV